MIGKFITFEGGEGSGKTTAIKHFSQLLSQHNIPFITTREPGGTQSAEKIRQLFVQGEPEDWDSVSEFLLVSAARRDHLQKFILPQLKQGVWVISDRFQDSSWVYQGYAGGVSFALIEHVYQEIAGDFQPDLTFILDIDPQIGLHRTHNRNAENQHISNEDRFEKKPLTFHEKIREGYHTLANNHPARCHLIQTSTIEGTFQAIEATFYKFATSCKNS